MTATPSRISDVADVRRLRTQLATLLASVEDLQQEWDATVELTLQLRAQRRRLGRPSHTAAVIADLEAVMRGSTALLPDYVPKLRTAEQLLPAIANAQRKYDDLVTQHLAWATTALNGDPR